MIFAAFMGIKIDEYNVRRTHGTLLLPADGVDPTTFVMVRVRLTKAVAVLLPSVIAYLQRVYVKTLDIILSCYTRSRARLNP
jgi:hypothetical protein